MVHATRALLLLAALLGTRALADDAQTIEQLRREKKQLADDLARAQGALAERERRLKQEEERLKEVVAELRSARELLVGREHDPLDAATREVLTRLLGTTTERLRACAKAELPDDQRLPLEVRDGSRRVFSRLGEAPYGDVAAACADAAEVLRLVPALSGILAERTRAWREELAAVREERERERQRLQAEVEGLRTRKNQGEDERIDEARKSDAERLKLLDEKEALQRELATRERDRKLEVARQESDSARQEARIAALEASLELQRQALEGRLFQSLDRQRISLSLEKAHPRAALVALAEATGVRHVLGQEDLARVGERTVTLRLDQAPTRAARDELAKQLGLSWRREGNDVRFTAP